MNSPFPVAQNKLLAATGRGSDLPGLANSTFHGEWRGVLLKASIDSSIVLNRRLSSAWDGIANGSMECGRWLAEGKTAG